MSGLDTLMIEGSVSINVESENNVILGWGIADQLGQYISDYSFPINLIVPKKGTKKGFAPGSEFNKKMAEATGVFSVNPDFDTKYVLGNLAFTQKLLDAKLHSATQKYCNPCLCRCCVQSNLE